MNQEVNWKVKILVPFQNSNSNKQTISVLIPCYNVEKYINRCIDSVLNQDYDMSLVKIICVNDGSTDSTLSILQEYEKKLGDEKFILIDQKNQGIFNTRRTLLSNLSTNWCIFLDSDDWWDKDCLRQYSKKFKKNSDVIYCTKSRIVSNTTRIWKQKYIYI